MDNSEETRECILHLFRLASNLTMGRVGIVKSVAVETKGNLSVVYFFTSGESLLTDVNSVENKVEAHAIN
jgi:hypothetical protein